MADNKTMVLDLTDCKYLMEMHRRIKEAFDFPDYYGENWDAFYDLMCTDCPVESIIIRGVSSMSDELARQLEMMKATLEDVKKDRHEHHFPFAYVIED